MSKNYGLELYELIMEDDLGNLYYPYISEFGWVSDTEFFIWISFDGFGDFIRDLTEIFGYGIFDDENFIANIQSDSVCIDLCEVLGGYVDIEEVFPKEKYQH